MKLIALIVKQLGNMFNIHETFTHLPTLYMYIHITPATDQQNKKGRVKMKNKQTFYFVLIPKREKVHQFGGLLAVQTETLARELSKEVGGAFIPSSYTLN